MYFDVYWICILICIESFILLFSTCSAPFSTVSFPRSLWGQSRVDESCLTWLRYVTHTWMNYVIHQRVMASRHSCSTASFPRSLQIYLYHYLILLTLHFNVIVFYLHYNLISNSILFVLKCLLFRTASFPQTLWGMARVDESRHIEMSHVTYEWVMSRVDEACHVWISHVTCE